MNGKLFFFVLACLFLCIAGCGNGNLFSWAHDEGKGGYKLLMADAQAAMKNKNYGKAAKYYRKALNKKPGDAAAVYGYSCAAFAAASGKNYEAIIRAVIDRDGNSSAGLLEFLDMRDAAAIKKTLDEILSPSMLPSMPDGAENKVDARLNAAISYLLLAAVSIITDEKININDLNINADFSMTIPDFASALQSVKDAVEGYILPNLAKAEMSLQSISSEGGSISRSLRSDVRKLINDIRNKGY